MKKTMILKILNELDKNNKLLTKEELGIDDEQYGQILEIMAESNLISGIGAKRAGSQGKYIISVNHYRLTLYGIDYLEQNR